MDDALFRVEHDADGDVALDVVLSGAQQDTHDMVIDGTRGKGETTERALLAKRGSATERTTAGTFFPGRDCSCSVRVMGAPSAASFSFSSSGNDRTTCACVMEQPVTQCPSARVPSPITPAP